MTRHMDPDGSRRDNILGTCVAGGFGALVLGIGDMLKVQDVSMMTRIAQMGRELGIPGAEGLLLPLLIVVALGVGVTWVHRPSLRVDGFVRGLSVFAFLGVVSPPMPEDDTLHDHHEGETMAVSDSIPAAPTRAPLTGVIGASSSLPDPGASAIIDVMGLPRGAPAFVTLRDSESRVVGRQTITNSRIRIVKDPGRYLVEVEAEGYGRIKFYLDLGVDSRYRVTLEPSKVPLSIQRLRAPRQVRLVRIGEEDADPRWAVKTARIEASRA